MTTREIGLMGKEFETQISNQQIGTLSVLWIIENHIEKVQDEVGEESKYEEPALKKGL
eukprot:CAMPEP_0170488300 /NCGR_PEP_ID=MMETSP0208-20121228/6888_1 /TAXON_ID=197538 /ORGANISM="Strombidium inclinatum, Strain S3" /LENGTH=57 /DNA_ID=CAMNT_0010762829 /DNA_START=204 /DNA_END=377 /DNA_ORIENTATION=-